MNNTFNDKNIPNQMRILIKKIRNDNKMVNESFNDSKKDLTIRDMLKITRSLNEDYNDNAESLNKKSTYDQGEEEEKFRNYFDDLNVDIKFINLKVRDNLIFWGGTIDGVIQFVYKVTPDENTSGIEFNYLPEFTADNPDNQKIIDKIESYYDIFYKYWRNNILQS